MEREFVHIPFNINLLTQFIDKKLSEYVEPERAGTPKGELIGLSKTKYHASLLCLTSSSLKEIARKVKIPYASVRRWNIEEAFKKQVEKNIEEFFNEFLVQAVEAIDGIDVKLREFYLEGWDNNTIAFLNQQNKIAGRPLLENLERFRGKRVIFTLRPINDANLYGDKLLRTLITKIISPRPQPSYGVATRLSLLIALRDIIFAREGESHELNLIVMESFLAVRIGLKDFAQEEIMSVLEKEKVSLKVKRLINNYIEDQSQTSVAVLDLLGKLHYGKSFST
jgi:hypothetical protein